MALPQLSRARTRVKRPQAWSRRAKVSGIAAQPSAAPGRGPGPVPCREARRKLLWWRTWAPKSLVALAGTSAAARAGSGDLAARIWLRSGWVDWPAAGSLRRWRAGLASRPSRRGLQLLHHAPRVYARRLPLDSEPKQQHPEPLGCRTKAPGASLEVCSRRLRCVPGPVQRAAGQSELVADWLFLCVCRLLGVRAA